MEIIKELISFIFSIGCLINSSAFCLQALKISKAKNSTAVSVSMLSLFTIFQTSGALYGYIHNDPKVMWGFIILLLSCSNTIRVAIKYKK